MNARPLDRDRDAPLMLHVALEAAVSTLHSVDLPYRLASWALDLPENAILWEDSRRVVGWAAMQAPFWMIDFAFLPEVEEALLPAALEWADGRAEAAHGSIYERPQWFVTTFGDLADRLATLERHGYVCQADVGEDSWSRVLLRRDATQPARASLPPGFVIRPFNGAREVDAYVELHRATFESKSMTPEWRTRTLVAPHHRTDADLVVESPDGRLAGFCIGWLSPPGPGPRVGQIEPLGVGRDFREVGLGAALLGECARRLAAAGARALYVETDTYRTPALGLYESLGFQPVREILVYRKDVPASAPRAP